MKNSKAAITLLAAVLAADTFGSIQSRTLAADTHSVHPAVNWAAMQPSETTVTVTTTTTTTNTAAAETVSASVTETATETDSTETTASEQFSASLDFLSQRKEEWLFVGDSRFEFWYLWGFGGEYIAESGQGLNMIYDNYDTITSYRGYNVVFNLGANQWWSAWEYVNLLNSLPDEFTAENHIIVMPVNPTDGRFSWMNEKFDAFNQILKENLRSDYEYVDTASYMKEHGFETADGLHYTTYQDGILYSYLIYGE